LQAPNTPWWPELVACAERGGSTEAELKAKLAAGHSMLWPVIGGCLVIDRTVDDAIVAWLGVGRGARNWTRTAEQQIGGLARSLGCSRLRIEGRRGWQRHFPHWTVKGTDGDTVTLELELA
jgi:hypothetical protein